jgi:hypothetical protein
VLPAVFSLTLSTVLACGGASPTSGESDTAPVIKLGTADSRGVVAIEVRGLSSAALEALRHRTPSSPEWTDLLRVDVLPPDDQASDTHLTLPAVAGAYSVGKAALVFSPMFGLDPGAVYRVTFDPSRLPVSAASGLAPVVTVVGLPKPTVAPSTIVDRVYPSNDVVPENLLRLYVHFSAPMGRKGGLEYLMLLDRNGREVTEPFLPLDADFWNADRTRFTVFLDPGRVKRGILPNTAMGRPLETRAEYTLVVDRDWRDAQGLPLKTGFRRRFCVGPPREEALEPVSRWRLEPPAAGATAPLRVVFPETLDHGLLMRALGVESADGTPVMGSAAVDADETRWSFSPAQPWRAGTHRLVVLTILEDPAGNRIGRPFEVDQFHRTDGESGPERVTRDFLIR